MGEGGDIVFPRIRIKVRTMPIPLTQLNYQHNQSNGQREEAE